MDRRPRWDTARPWCRHLAPGAPRSLEGRQETGELEPEHEEVLEREKVLA